jgi:hypothetical protein
MAVIYLILLILLAAMLYWLRRNYRLAYAFIEIAAGIGTLIVSIYPPYILIAACEISAIGARFSSSLTIMAGLYIIVRGMDNLDQALPAKWRRIWDRIFDWK